MGGKDSSNHKFQKMVCTMFGMNFSMESRRIGGKSEAPGILSKLSLLCVNHRIIEKSSTQVVQDLDLHREYQLGKGQHVFHLWIYWFVHTALLTFIVLKKH